MRVSRAAECSNFTLLINAPGDFTQAPSSLAGVWVIGVCGDALDEHLEWERGVWEDAGRDCNVSHDLRRRENSNRVFIRASNDASLDAEGEGEYKVCKLHFVAWLVGVHDGVLVIVGDGDSNEFVLDGKHCVFGLGRH